MVNKLLPGICFALLYSSCANSDVAYVDIYKMHQEFELQKVYATYLKSYKDSAANSMDTYILSGHIGEGANMEDVKRAFFEEVQKSVTAKTDSLNAIIWKRLNPLIQEYGKEHNYKMILGANGSGTLLYSDTALDITNDIIIYVNKKYNGL